MFDSSRDCAASVIEMQRSLTSHVWPGGEHVRVRMGVHAGEARQRSTGLVGFDVHKAARVASAAHGGQILLSETAASLVRDFLPGGASLRDLGLHRLKDLGRPEQIFQLDIEGLPHEFPRIRSLDNPELENNLPAQLSSFIGRGDELIQIHEAVGTSRLVTLTGPGGSGKTRLALQVAAELLDGSGDGVWLIELAAIADPASVANEVAKVLRVREAPTASMLETLVSVLRSRNMLLVLDNCEHVIASVADLAETVLRSCPEVHILATSREALAIPGEKVIRIAPMSTPPVEIEESEDLRRFESVSLFEDRGISHHPSFQLDSSSAPHVASICRHLDGIPLAIELAAARLPSLSVADIEERLEHRFRLLTSGSRTALPRQQTLLAAVDWSYDLLTDDEKSAFNRLSVFIGGWDLRSAEAVCDPSDSGTREFADVLSSLVEKSLVQSEAAAGGAMRYRQLETIRDYADSRLREEDSSSLSSTQDAHAAVFLALTETAATHLTGPDQSHWLARLEVEHENVVGALSHFVETGDSARALRFAISMREFWIARGYYHEGIGILESTLDLANEPAALGLRAEGVVACGILRQAQGDTERARANLEEGLALAHRLDVPHLMADALCELAWLEYGEDNNDLALHVADEAISTSRRVGDLNLIGFAMSIRASAVFPLDPAQGRADFDEAIRCFRSTKNNERLSSALCRLAIHELEDGNLDVARAHLATVLDISSDLHNDGLFPHVYAALGKCEMLDSDHIAARERFRDCMGHARRVDDGRVVAYATFGLAYCATAAGESDAAKLHGAADGLLEFYGEKLEPTEMLLREHDHLLLSQALGSEVFNSTYTEGRELAPDDAIAFACRYLMRAPVGR